MKKLRILSLFSGIGAFEQALTNVGIETEIVNYCEIDKYAAKSYSILHNVSEDLNLGDITKVDLTHLPNNIDMITHGSPCQSFSIAGKQEGGDEGSHTRSSLLWNSVEIIKKVRPKYVIWENVKNVISDKHKHNFEKYLNVLESSGYTNNYKVLNAKSFNSPQNRERLICISILNMQENDAFEFPVGKDTDIRLCDILEPEKNIDKKYILNSLATEKFIATVISEKDVLLKQNRTECKVKVLGSLDIKDLERQRRVYSIDGISPSLLARSDSPKILLQKENENSLQQTDSYYIRRLTPREVWRVMGFGDACFDKVSGSISATQLFKQAGNSIVVPMLETIMYALLHM